MLSREAERKASSSFAGFLREISELYRPLTFVWTSGKAENFSAADYLSRFVRPAKEMKLAQELTLVGLAEPSHLLPIQMAEFGAEMPRQVPPELYNENKQNFREATNLIRHIKTRSFSPNSWNDEREISTKLRKSRQPDYASFPYGLSGLDLFNCTTLL